MQKQSNLTTYKGIGMGLVAGMTWGLDGVLYGICVGGALLTKDPAHVLLAPFVCAMLHDIISCLWALIYTVATKRTGAFVQAFKTKSGRFIMLAAVCGSFAMVCYYLSIQNIGAGYATAISSIFPAVTALLSYLILKEKLPKTGWLGIAICVVATAFLGYTTDSPPKNVLLGVVFSVLAAFGWSFEGVICAYGMKQDVSSETALQMRQFISGLTLLIAVGVIGKGFPLAREVLTDPVAWMLTLTALAGTISYFCYYRAIDTIGPIRAVGLNITYSVWAIIFGLMLGQGFRWQLALGCIAVIIGVMLTVGKPETIAVSEKVQTSEVG